MGTEMDAAWESRYYPATTSAFDAATEEHDFTALVREADRHGSIVWEATEERDGHRYVTVAITQVDANGAGVAPRYNVEVWAAAADDESYARRLVASFDPGDAPVKQYVQLLNGTIVVAIRRARGISRDELRRGDEIMSVLPMMRQDQFALQLTILAASAMSAISMETVEKLLRSSFPPPELEQIAPLARSELLHGHRDHDLVIDELARAYVDATSTWMTDDVRNWIEQVIESVSKSMAEAMSRSSIQEGSR